MNNPKIFSLDIETLDIPSTSIVTSIAWVDVGTILPNGELKTKEQPQGWKYVLASEPQVKLGRTESLSTRTFREGTPNGAMELNLSTELNNPDNLKALTCLSTFRQMGFWFAQGTDFDFPILNSLFKDYSRLPPWDYWAKLDLRTLKMIGVAEQHDSEINHDSLSDARAQGLSISQIDPRFLRSLHETWNIRS